MATELWLNNTVTLPEGVVYTVTSNCNSSSVLQYPPPSCSLMEVVIVNNDDSFTFPCFSCSGFNTTANYENHFRRCLIDAISDAVVLPTLNCAAAIAEDVLRSVFLPANGLVADKPTHIVEILVNVLLCICDDDDDKDNNDDIFYDAIDELFEEVGPQRKSCTIDSLIEMVMAKAELEALEGEKAERDWKESGNRNCTICMEEIESVWESLKLPCSHVFHEKCALKWLDNNHVCPLCRFELPLESCVEDDL